MFGLHTRYVPWFDQDPVIVEPISSPLFINSS